MLFSSVALEKRLIYKIYGGVQRWQGSLSQRNVSLK
jgi:hypothetical protein